MRKYQERIIQELHVQPSIDPEKEFHHRVSFVMNYIESANRINNHYDLSNPKIKGLILGISGGQDSTLKGKISQTAIDRLNRKYHTTAYRLICVRLPYGIQNDESDAQDAISFIKGNHPDKQDIITYNIKAISDQAEKTFNDAVRYATLSDFSKGNNKARQRMAGQYDLAATVGGFLVAGTDHAAENVTRFFTKFGDGGVDLIALFGLNKRQGKSILHFLHCPKHLYLKTPTADLETNSPQLSDEDALGFTYDQLDDYLEGKTIDPKIAIQIEIRYFKDEHKVRGPVTPYDTWFLENEKIVSELYYELSSLKP